MSSNLPEENKYYSEKKVALAQAYGEDTFVAVKDSKLWGIFKSSEVANEWVKGNIPGGHALVKRLDEQ